MPLVATAPLVEVFVSVQGEGPQVGVPTLFVRTAGCPLRCTYCDTVESYAAEPSFDVRRLDGTRVVRLGNPSEPEDLLGHVARAGLIAGVEWISLTGGEPSLWPDYGVDLLRRARALGLRTQLESAAQDVDRLRPFLDVLDFYSMDWKFPSTLHRDDDVRDAHLACLDAALNARVATSVKVVLTAGSTDAEWQDMIARLRAFARRFILVIQPVTPCLDEDQSVPAHLLLERLRSAMDAGFDVRLLPQVHPHLGID